MEIHSLETNAPRVEQTAMFGGFGMGELILIFPPTGLLTADP